MDGQQAFPDPRAGDLWTPDAVVGPESLPVRYGKAKKGQSCNDCEHCILQHLQGRRPEGSRIPGAPLPALHTRVQGDTEWLLCEGHYQLRQEY